MDSGTTVKEYVSNQSGLVFAVACYGPARPPLREVLGAAVLSTFPSAPATSWSTRTVFRRRPFAQDARCARKAHAG
ncbi:DUF2844 domain-containing protein [Paraburkholderia youngii]|uniref:DUF2844 domain-containing protein n=1 Tax=Paraburkholderia youngii TaxID=2782701 RepID=UPI003D258F12